MQKLDIAPVMPTAAARRAAVSPNLTVGSARLEPSGAFPSAAGITCFCSAVVSRYPAHGMGACVYVYVYVYIYAYTNA